MFSYDVAIIGGGPAGLTAGLYLSRSNYKTVLLEIGGYITNVEWIENYPGFADGISGAQLASEMISQATKYGLELKLAEVKGFDLYSRTRSIKFEEGFLTVKVVILAGGAHQKKLGVPGEEALQGKGVFSCALCDGDEFSNQQVAVCGGGDAGVTEALYLTKLASKVILFEAEPALTATAILQDRALSNPKLEIHCGAKIQAILGQNRVEAIDFLDVGSGRRETIKVDGVLVHIGLEPNTEYLKGIVPLDSQGQIIVNEKMETEVPFILAAGDIRSGSPCQIATAVGDGAIAAISAQRLLQELE